MKKFLFKIISLVLCLVFASSMTVFAKTGEHVHSDTCQHSNIDDVDEYLAQLNAGLIIPQNTTITTFGTTLPIAEDNDSNISITPYWPWTECSNVLGHSWGRWGSWQETSRIHFTNGTKCSASMNRYSFCSRTNCNAYQIEESSVWVNCHNI